MKPLLAELEFVVLDLETTGFDPDDGAEIIEVGAVLLAGDEEVGSFQEMVQPSSSIPEDVQALTGITPGDVEDARPVEAVLDDFVDFIGDRILVAHNADFDIPFLQYYSDTAIDNDVVDTLEICRGTRRFSSNKLDDLTKRFDIGRQDSHRALEDARATGRLLSILADGLTTYADYRDAGIPDSLAVRDIRLVVDAVPRLSGQTRRWLREHLNTTDQLREQLGQSEEALDACSVDERDELESFLNKWDEYDGDYKEFLREHGLTRLKDTVDSAYWSPVNWLMNATGLALLTGSVIGTRDPKTFVLLVVLSVPFFISSIGICYLRGRRHGFLKQLLFTIIVFGFAVLYLLTKGYIGWTL